MLNRKACFGDPIDNPAHAFLFGCAVRPMSANTNISPGSRRVRSLIARRGLPFLVGLTCACTVAWTQETNQFYLPENPKYTIAQSVLDSLRFTLNRTVRVDAHKHLVSTSSFVDPEGAAMGWHDFGNLEGPGWAANAVGGAYEIYVWGQFTGQQGWQKKALQILDHVLECGFVDPDSGFIRPYRNTVTGEFCLNYKHRSDWLCPGSLAKIGYQLLIFADELGNTTRAQHMREVALGCSRWLDTHLEAVPNGWYPRRCTPDGRLYRQSPEGGNDPFWQTSADGLFIVQLQTALTQRKLHNYTDVLQKKARVFADLGGIFGSINHDTYDPHENVAYSVAFRVLLPLSRLLHDDSLRQFAYERCLAGLEQFKMTQDRNGVATRGLLFMEKSWDTAYLWENAEAALASFEASADLRTQNPSLSRYYELQGLVILRAIARHHYGPHGFLTEGVDWNNHVGKQHHINQAEFAAIRYTEPFLNHQHIAEPTWFYLRSLAIRSRPASHIQWRDTEGNLLLTR
jgi:hypothetical protein